MRYRFRIWYVGILAILAWVGLGPVMANWLASWPRREFMLLSDENKRELTRFSTKVEYVALLGPPNSKPHREFYLRHRSIEILSWQERATAKEQTYVRWLDVTFDRTNGQLVEHCEGVWPVYHLTIRDLIRDSVTWIRSKLWF